jgi:hypothetical protein
VEQTPEGYVPMLEATHILGVSCQTVLQRIKRGELRPFMCGSDGEKA